MTSVEGGFLVVRDEDDALRCVMLREHGWIRRLPPAHRTAYVDSNPALDEQYLFADMGYNFRPTDITAVIGRVQLPRLDGFNTSRRRNFQHMLARLKDVPGVALPETVAGAEVAFLALVLTITDPAVCVREFRQSLEFMGVETRPVISGNFARQPCLGAWGVAHQAPESLPGAEAVHWGALYVGLHGQEWSDAKCDSLCHAIRVAMKTSHTRPTHGSAVDKGVHPQLVPDTVAVCVDHSSDEVGK